MKTSTADRKAATGWKRANNAYRHYREYLETKSRRLDLTVVDLVFVRNFKGGSTIVAEPPETLRAKLKHYSQALASAHANGALGTPLGRLSGPALARARGAMLSFVGLSLESDTHVDGFGPSFTSALLHFHFPATVPILDRRALNGARIRGVKRNKQGQVRDIEQHYPALIDYCAGRLRRNPKLDLRELDRELFVRRI